MIKYTNVAASLLVAFMAISGAKGQSPALSSPIIRAWQDDLNRHDTLALAGLYADSARIFSPNWEGAQVGKAGIRETYRRYFASTPDLQHEVIRVLVTDSVLVIEYLFRGTLSNPEASSPAYMKGKKYELSCCTRMDIRNGKIWRQTSYFDQVAFLRQVGFFEHLGN